MAALLAFPWAPYIWSWVEVQEALPPLVLRGSKRYTATAKSATPAINPITIPAIAPPLRPDEDEPSDE
eukprot:scaffold143_cov364-Pavlova_lutheri.AAC.15